MPTQRSLKVPNTHINMQDNPYASSYDPEDVARRAKTRRFICLGFFLTIAILSAAYYMVFIGPSRVPTYASLIHQDALAVMRIDLASMAENGELPDAARLDQDFTAFTQETFGSSLPTGFAQLTSNPEAAGLDVKQPLLIAFEDIKEGLSVSMFGGISSADAFVKTLGQTQQDQASRMTYCLTPTCGVFTADDVFVLTNRLQGENDSKFVSRMAKAFATTDETHTMAQSELMETLCNHKASVTALLTGNGFKKLMMRNDVERKFNELNPYTLDFLFTLSETQGEQALTAEVLTKDPEWKAFLADLDKATAPIGTSLMAYTHPSQPTLVANIDGTTLARLIDQLLGKDILEKRGLIDYHKVMSAPLGNLACTMQDSTHYTAYFTTRSADMIGLLPYMRDEMEVVGTQQYRKDDRQFGVRDSVTYFLRGTTEAPFTAKAETLSPKRIDGKRILLRLPASLLSDSKLQADADFLEFSYEGHSHCTLTLQGQHPYLYLPTRLFQQLMK